MAVTLYSNRSAAYTALSNWERAASDGQECIDIDPTFIKGYYRTAYALNKLNKLDEALQCVRSGLQVDPENVDLNNIEQDLIGYQNASLNASLAAELKT